MRWDLVKAGKACSVPRRGPHVADALPGTGSTNEGCQWGRLEGASWRVVHCLAVCVSRELEEHGVDSGCR